MKLSINEVFPTQRFVNGDVAKKGDTSFLHCRLF